MPNRVKLNKIHLSVIRLGEKEIKESNYEFSKIYRKGDRLFLFNLYNHLHRREIYIYVAKEDKFEDLLPEILNKITEFLNKKYAKKKRK